jgi:signal transduction histidine kinase
VIGGASTRGAGLAGLTERVAALGGGCEAGPATDGSWRLAVSLPADATAGTESEARRLELAADGQLGAQAQHAEKRITQWFG